MRASSLKFKIYIIAEISNICTSMQSLDLNIALLTISTDNIQKLYGLELKDISIQQEFNFIGKDRTIIHKGKEH